MAEALPKKNKSEEAGPSSSSNPFKEKVYTSWTEYSKDLDLWLHQVYFWSGVTAAFPYFLACNQFGTNQEGARTEGAPFVFQSPFTPQAQQQRAQEPSPTVTPETPPDGIECRIPSLWKRIAAETIDFLILFFLKLAMTFIAVDFFDIVDLDKFDFDAFQKDTKLEYKAFLQMTHDIIILEFVHRIVVCVFETFWLIGGSNGRLGGATPGKSIMGLRVIKCDTSTAAREGDDQLVVVRPGTDLGLWTSVARACVKNVVMTLLIPAGFAFLFLRHNRTGYDMVCNTIVVEEPLVPHRQHQD